jgi:hypothetical protein
LYLSSTAAVCRKAAAAAAAASAAPTAHLRQIQRQSLPWIFTTAFIHEGLAFTSSSNCELRTVWRDSAKGTAPGLCGLPLYVMLHTPVI